MSSEAKVFKFEEVAKHNSKDQCWLIISGKVYDVTPFLDDHPGGDEILLTATGKDATDDFEDVGHSNDAREMMKKYYIGEVDVSTIPVKQKPVRPQVMREATQQSQAAGFLIKVPAIHAATFDTGVGIRFEEVEERRMNSLAFESRSKLWR